MGSETHTGVNKGQRDCSASGTFGTCGTVLGICCTAVGMKVLKCTFAKMQSQTFNVYSRTAARLPMDYRQYEESDPESEYDSNDEEEDTEYENGYAGYSGGDPSSHNENPGHTSPKYPPPMDEEYEDEDEEEVEQLTDALELVRVARARFVWLPPTLICRCVLFHIYL